MKQQHTYNIYIYSNVGGLHSLERMTYHVGSKSGAIKKAREEKKNVDCRLPLHYEIVEVMSDGQEIRIK